MRPLIVITFVAAFAISMVTILSVGIAAAKTADGIDFKRVGQSISESITQ